MRLLPASAAAMAVAPVSPIWLKFKRSEVWLLLLAPTPHTLHTTASAVLAPTPPPNYLHVSPGDARRSAHTRMLARSLPSTTANGPWVGALAVVPTPHTLHTIALAMLTSTRPPNYLPASPGDGRRTARTRVASAPLRSARRKIQHCGTWVC